MASRFSSPLVLAWVAFFPLLAWEGGITGLARRPPEGRNDQPPRRLPVGPAASEGQPAIPGTGWTGGMGHLPGADSPPPALAGTNSIAQPSGPPLRRLPLVPSAPKPAPPATPYAAFVDQFRNLGATYVRLERRRRGPAVEYLACCQSAGDARLEAQGDSPEAALDQLLAELRARDVSAPHP